MIVNCPAKNKCRCMQHRLWHSLKNMDNKEALKIIGECPKLLDLIDVASGDTLLHRSVQRGNAEMVEYLLEKGCNIGVKNAAGITPLMLAFNVLCLEPGGKLPEGKPSAVLRTIVDKVNEDFVKQGATAIQWLLVAEDSVKVIVAATAGAELSRLLLANGCPIDYQKTLMGLTALHVAMLFRRLENAKILIERGARQTGIFLTYYFDYRFEKVDEDSAVLKSLLKCPEHVSCRCIVDGEEEGIEELLSNGNRQTVRTILILTSGIIDVKDCLFADKPVFHLLVENSSGDDVLSLLDELNIKFDVDQRDRIGLTALMLAVSDGSPEKVQYLLEHGADMTLININGYSALTSIYLREEPDKNDSNVVRNAELLLQYGARDASLWFTSDYYDEWIARRTKWFAPVTYVIVGHLAMLHVLGQPPLSKLCRKRINAHPPLKSHFKVCVSQLKTMKRSEVYGSVMLFDLLTATDEKLVSYARNPELIEAVENSPPNWSHLQAYYYRRVKNRLERAKDEVKLRENVALAIETLTELSSVKYPLVFDRVINYLTRKDKNNLCKI